MFLAETGRKYTSEHLNEMNPKQAEVCLSSVSVIIINHYSIIYG